MDNTARFIGVEGTELAVPEKIASHLGDSLSGIILSKGTNSTVYKLSGSNGVYALKVINSLVHSKKHKAALQEVEMLTNLKAKIIKGETVIKSL